ncbi:MAG: DUF1244 domain-containing protein [Gammaproteobacteria bacterium]|nr:DUF1244 domain-containing protein [Gammaproteobacteria bacterium]
MSTKQETELDAAVLRRLIAHLDSRKDVQNIELMILAGFCRNCLSKWYAEAAKERGIDVDLSVAQERIYGMSYADWKAKHQTPATPEQLERYEAAQQKSG